MNFVTPIVTGAKVVGNFVVKHRSIECVVIGSIGAVGTLYYTAKGGALAIERIKEAEAKKGSPLTTKEKIVTGAPCFVKPLLFASGTGIALGGGYYFKCKEATDATKKAAEATGLAIASQALLSDFQKVTEEVAGKETYSTIQNAVTKKHIDEEEDEIYPGETKCWIYDEWNGRRWIGTEEELDNAIESFNQLIGASRDLEDDNKWSALDNPFASYAVFLSFFKNAPVYPIDEELGLSLAEDDEASIIKKVSKSSRGNKVISFEWVSKPHSNYECWGYC